MAVQGRRRGGVMRENRRGTPRQARAGGRAGTWRDARGQSSAGRDGGPGDGRASRDGGRPGPGNRGGAPGTPDTPRGATLIEPLLPALEMDLEAVKIAAARGRRGLGIIVDAAGGGSLEDIARGSPEGSG